MYEGWSSKHVLTTQFVVFQLIEQHILAVSHSDSQMSCLRRFLELLDHKNLSGEFSVRPGKPNNVLIRPSSHKDISR